MEKGSVAVQAVEVSPLEVTHSPCLGDSKALLSLDLIHSTTTLAEMTCAFIRCTTDTNGSPNLPWVCGTSHAGLWIQRSVFKSIGTDQGWGVTEMLGF